MVATSDKEEKVGRNVIRGPERQAAGSVPQGDDRIAENRRGHAAAWMGDGDAVVQGCRARFFALANLLQERIGIIDLPRLLGEGDKFLQKRGSRFGGEIPSTN